MTRNNSTDDPFPMDPRAFRAATRNSSPLLAVLLIISLGLLVACAARQFQTAAKTPRPPAPTQGDTAPDFTLDDAHGGKVTLSQLKKPTLIVFFLGYECPRCVRHLKDLANHKADFDKLDVQILAISPDPIELSRQAIRDFGDFPFPILSDPDKKVAASYGVLLGDDVLFHGVYVLDEDRRIQFSLRSDHPYDNASRLLKEFEPPAPATRRKP